MTVTLHAGAIQAVVSFLHVVIGAVVMYCILHSGDTHHYSMFSWQ